jgi:hypothetical protein
MPIVKKKTLLEMLMNCYRSVSTSFMYLLIVGFNCDMLWTSCVKPATEDCPMNPETCLVIKETPASLDKFLVLYLKDPSHKVVSKVLYHGLS